MTNVKVCAGACGFTTMVHVMKIDRTIVEITVNSPCEMIKAFIKSMGTLQWMNVFAKVKDR